jgi:hypothetical protein
MDLGTSQLIFRIKINLRSRQEQEEGTLRTGEIRPRPDLRRRGKEFPCRSTRTGGETTKTPSSHLSRQWEEFGEKRSPNEVKETVKRVKYPGHQTCPVRNGILDLELALEILT